MLVVNGNEQLLFQVVLALACGSVVSLVSSPARWRPLATVVASVLTYGYAIPAVSAVTLLVYGTGRLVRADFQGKLRDKALRWRLSQAAIAALSVAFVALRLSHVGSTAHGLAPGWQVSVIDMWMALRLATFLYDTGSGRIGDARVSDFLSWVFLPFQVFGPLLRYTAFTSQRTAGAEALIATGARLKTGLLGLAQIAIALAIGAGQDQLNRQVTHTAAQVVSLAFSGPWTFYLLTAGYFKTMEAAAQGWGLKLPQSFNNPFAKRSLSAFWASWNMSATATFRDAFFYTRWTRGPADVFINTFVIFVLVGAWHGTNAYWLLWGTLHALGFCIYLTISRRNPEGPGTSGGAVALVKWFTTYTFVVFCWAAPPQIMKLGARLL